MAGAINYVTSDASEEFEGKVTVTATDLGQKEIGLLLSGPINDSLGYRVSYVDGQNDGPDESRSSEGEDLGSQETKRFTGKLNFKFSETAYGEVMFGRLEALDGPGAAWTADPTTCGPTTGVIRSNMGAMTALLEGAWDCDTSAPSGGLPRNTAMLEQFSSQYNANIGAYSAAFGMADANMNGSVSLPEFLAQTDRAGAPYEQLLLQQSVETG